MKLLISLLGLILITSCSSVIEVSEQHYRIYRANGTSASLQDLLRESKAADVTFLGEDHNDPVAHYLENIIFTQSWKPSLALSLEMFESDVQYVVDEYLLDLIREDHLIESGRAWQNYEDDYKPLIEFAKENNLPVIAANAPRRYVNMVSRTGVESLSTLSEQAKQYLPPLPYAEASKAYAKKFRDLMSHGSVNQTAPDSNIAKKELNEEEKKEAEKVVKEAALRLDRTVQAQSLWDSSMAWSIASFIIDNPGSQVLHLNGAFHSAERMGIVDHLNLYRPQTSVLVITMIPSNSFPQFSSEEMLNQGDFVIVTDGSLPRSY